jgi:hypothetical protein
MLWLPPRAFLVHHRTSKKKKRKFAMAATQPIRVYVMHSDNMVAVHDPRITV